MWLTADEDLWSELLLHFMVPFKHFLRKIHCFVYPVFVGIDFIRCWKLNYKTSEHGDVEPLIMQGLST